MLISVIMSDRMERLNIKSIDNTHCCLCGVFPTKWCHFLEDDVIKAFVKEIVQKVILGIQETNLENDYKLDQYIVWNIWLENKQNDRFFIN